MLIKKGGTKMKYFFKINDTEFSNCSALSVADVYRGETKKQTLSGTLLYDRIGNAKLQATAKLNMITEAEMQALRDAVSDMTATVSFYRGSVLVEKTMRIEPFTEPTPIYLGGKLDNGIIYGTLNIKAVEL
ncbi:MAG: hypothetical protein IJ366_00610 [Clostridia bacterium]|nr:hypothetical protein [Clostridia bacterium]MBQ7792999.1 hypothetical protein [Clostridia bacterium]